MKITLPLISAAALLALAGCGSNEPETINQTIQLDQGANVGNVVLPPPVKSSGVYRCEDGTVVYVDYLADNLTATIRTETGPSTTLKATAEGEPFTAEGYSVSGNATAIKATMPGKGSQSCTA